jgi:hypothetical protein
LDVAASQQEFDQGDNQHRLTALSNHHDQRTVESGEDMEVELA